MMPQSTRTLTTAYAKPAVLLKTVKEGMAESLGPPLHKDSCIFTAELRAPTRLPFKEEIFSGFVRPFVISSGFSEHEIIMIILF